MYGRCHRGIAGTEAGGSERHEMSGRWDVVEGERMSTSTGNISRRRRNPLRGARRRHSFTLLEVVLALSLMIAMMAGIYEYYLSTMRARDAAIRSLRQTLMMRALLEQIAEDLRHITDISPDNVGFVGTEEQLTFVRMGVPDMGMALQLHDSMSQDAKPGQEDLVRITYMLKRDTEEKTMDVDGTPVVYGMLRSTPQLIDPNPQFTVSVDAQSESQDQSGSDGSTIGTAPTSTEDLIPDVKYLRFWYYDGKTWHPRWQAPAAEATGTTEGAESSDSSSDDTSGGDTSGGDTSGDDTTGTDKTGSGKTGTKKTSTKKTGTKKTSTTKTSDTDGDSTGSDKTSGSLLGGTSSSGSDSAGASLPQAIQIIIGTTKVPLAEDEFDISRVTEENEVDNETYHPDRWAIRVYLRQSDQSLLSSRSHGINVSGEQETSTDVVGGLR